MAPARVLYVDSICRIGRIHLLSCIYLVTLTNYCDNDLDCVYLSHRSPEILALVPRVHFALEGRRRDRVVQRLNDLVVDRPRLPESVLRFE